MEQIYPAGPESVPENLTRPTAAYKQRAWLAMAVLLLFVLLYFFLAGWFSWTAYRLIAGAINGGGWSFEGIVVGFCAAFLAIFMLKALVFVKRGGKSDDIEITADQQPRLFAFLHRLADEAGAPRPYRVYLSPRVNASVFYDLSILNLLWPSKKNLEIGLGLVNVVSLGELKAVLAHEFGHFAQRTMAVGSWVYVGQQIAAHIIAKRDALDEFLINLSNTDFRIAWVGWLLRLIVWSIRSLMETVFDWVVLAQRALSRQMEMQADLVAVSLTGSDALIHALYRIQAGDESWARSIDFANEELSKSRAIADIFSIQTRVIEHTATILSDPNYGRVPYVPSASAAHHRLFKSEIAQPPEMWSSHPYNHDREENAKRAYVSAPQDTRSAWELFDDPAKVRTRMSAYLLRQPELPVPPIEESLKTLDQEFERECYKREYRGSYLGRSITRCAAHVDALYSPVGNVNADDLARLYPESLIADIEHLRNLHQERVMLEHLRDGLLQPPEGVIRYHGKELARKDLPRTIESLQKTIREVQEKVAEHDRLCRSAHRAAAAGIGKGWEGHLIGLASVLHYADHAESNLRDVQRFLGNTVHVVLAGGKVSDAGLKRVLNAAGETYKLLKEVFDHREQLTLDSTLKVRMGVEKWADALEELRLGPPAKDNINEWMKVIDGWINAACAALSKLRGEALEQLLVSEAQVACHYRTQAAVPVEEAPTPATVPASYSTLVDGSERAMQTQLGWWARFQNSIGTFPTIARLLVAMGIVGTVLGFGGGVGVATVTMYNGLAIPVQVRFGETKSRVAAFSHTKIELPPGERYVVQTTTSAGQLIESFDADVGGNFSNHVYNVAGATALVESTITYGNATPRPDVLLGAPRWSKTAADHIFTDPPKEVRTKGGGATRSALMAGGSLSPQDLLGALQTDAEKERLAVIHARWDGPSSKHILTWMGIAARSKDFPAILQSRLKIDPHDMPALRFEQDLAPREARGPVCERHLAIAAAHPKVANLQYLAVRCVENEDARNEGFLKHFEAWPQNGWAAYAAGHTMIEQQRWNDAINALEIALKNEPALAESVAMDLARLRRLVSADGKANLSDLATGTDILKTVQAIESGQSSADSPLLAYTELLRGNLSKAVDIAARKLPAEYARIVRLAAASEGASPELIRKALALPVNEGIDSATVWSAIALAHREKADVAPFLARLKEASPHQTEPLLNIIQLLREGNIKGAENGIGRLGLELRGQLYSTGVVMLGAKAPVTWREGAKRILFGMERPYFK
jgi:Zn-dependent protease with chaperone function